MGRAMALILLGAITSGGFLAGGCGLKKRYRCSATASYAGKDRVGHGNDFDSEPRARELARADLCAEYCRSEDPDVEAAYQKVKGPKDTNLERLSAIHNEPVLSALNACKTRCSSAMAAATFEYSCEYSGL
jgi:hypothetical protein